MENIFFPDRCPLSHPYVYYNGKWCCQTYREKHFTKQGTKCDGSIIQRDSLCCEGDSHVSCPGGSGICDSYYASFDPRGISRRQLYTYYTQFNSSSYVTNTAFLTTLIRWVPDLAKLPLILSTLLYNK
jgi:hypothetical protein